MCILDSMVVVALLVQRRWWHAASLAPEVLLALSLLAAAAHQRDAYLRHRSPAIAALTLCHTTVRWMDGWVTSTPAGTVG